MNIIDLNDETLHRLRTCALEESISADDLLNRLLDHQPVRENPASLYQKLLEHTSDTVSLFDLDLRYLYVNPIMERLTGLDLAAFIGKTDHDLGLPEQLVNDLKSAWQVVIASQQEQIITFDYPTVQGQRYYESRLTPVLNAGGSVECLLAITRDITNHIAAETALNQSRHDLQALVENFDGSIWSIDTDYRLIVANSVFRASIFAAIGRDPVTGENLLHLNMPSAVLAEWRGYYDRALQGEKFSIELATRFSPSPREVEYRFNPIKTDTDQIAGVTIFARDITEQRRAAEQLRRSEANLRAMLDSTWQSFTLIDREYRIMDIDQKGRMAAEAIFGKRILPDSSIHDFVFPHDLEGFNANFQRALAGETITLEKGLRGVDGTTHYFEFTYYPVIDQNGVIIGVCMSNCNITPRRQAELNLRQSEERYRLLAQNVTDMISRHTPDGIYTYATPSVETLLGYRPEDLIGHSAYEFFHPEDFSAIQQSHQNILEHPLIATVQYRILCKDGHYIWFETTSRIVLDPLTDEPLEIIAVSRDITGRKQAEATLRQSEALLKEAQATAHLGSWEVNLQTGANIWSDEFFRICGIEPGTLEPSTELGLSIIHPDDRARAIAAFQAAQQTGQPYKIDKRIVRPNGEIRWVISEGEVSFDAHDQPHRLAGTFLDITERKQVEEALSQSEARLRSLLETQTAFVVRSDLNGRYTYVNQSFASRYRWLDENLIGHSLLETVIPGDQEKAVAAAQACLAEPGKPVQVVLGKTVPDASSFWTLWEFVAIQGSDRTITEIQCIGFDITEQIQGEQIRLEQERLKANLKKEQQFNALIQKAVSTLSHDVRIPLTIISTAKDMLNRYFDRLNESQRREKLESIGRQLHYVIELLDDVTTTVKGSLDNKPFKPERVNLAALCQICIHEIQATIGIKHQMLFVTDERITSAVVDETLVSRILINLLSNAVKFSPPESEIRLELGCSDHWIVLCVVDQGMGISEADQQHIFEPFYRTESAQHINGTGLGLNIVQDCVEHHQGSITVASIIGQGTVFTIKLPLLPG